MTYIAKIGIPDDQKRIDDEINDREILVNALDKYEAHKKALMESNLREEVLSIKEKKNNELVVVYTLNHGFSN